MLKHKRDTQGAVGMAELGKPVKHTYGNLKVSLEDASGEHAKQTSLTEQFSNTKQSAKFKTQQSLARMQIGS